MRSMGSARYTSNNLITECSSAAAPPSAASNRLLLATAIPNLNPEKKMSGDLASLPFLHLTGSELVVSVGACVQLWPYKSVIDTLSDAPMCKNRPIQCNSGCKSVPWANEQRAGAWTLGERRTSRLICQRFSVRHACVPVLHNERKCSHAPQQTSVLYCSCMRVGHELTRVLQVLDPDLLFGPASGR